jgi:hypothetical protein
MWGATAITQQANFTVHSDGTTGNASIPGLTDTGNSDANDNDAKLLQNIEEIRTILKNLGAVAP